MKLNKQTHSCTDITAILKATGILSEVWLTHEHMSYSLTRDLTTLQVNATTLNHNFWPSQPNVIRQAQGAAYDVHVNALSLTLYCTICVQWVFCINAEVAYFQHGQDFEQLHIRSVAIREKKEQLAY